MAKSHYIKDKPQKKTITQDGVLLHKLEITVYKRRKDVRMNVDTALPKRYHQSLSKKIENISGILNPDQAEALINEVIGGSFSITMVVELTPDTNP